jgi:hypothetical protein
MWDRLSHIERGWCVCRGKVNLLSLFHHLRTLGDLTGMGRSLRASFFSS